MEMTYFTLILCAALLVGLGLPGLIYFSSRKKKGVNEYDVFSRVMEKYRQAWTADQDEMQELSRQVESLQVKRARNLGSKSESQAGRDAYDKNETSSRS
jgi:hypothetical protein